MIGGGKFTERACGVDVIALIALEEAVGVADDARDMSHGAVFVNTAGDAGLL